MRQRDRMALTLTRTEGQSIILAVDRREICVEIADINGSQVRFAITAPDDVAIWREEVLDR